MPRKKAKNAKAAAALPASVSKDDYVALNEAIHRALDKQNGGGWPTWSTPGTGGDLPNRVKHEFGWHSLQKGARIDFRRGTIREDPGNFVLAEIASHLPVLATDPRLSDTDKNRGNMMECILGISYAAKTDGLFMPEGTELHFHSQKNKELFCNVWDVLQAQFGFGPAIDGPLLRRAGHTLLNIKGHPDTEDTMSHMSDEEVADTAMEPCCKLLLRYCVPLLPPLALPLLQLQPLPLGLLLLLPQSPSLPSKLLLLLLLLLLLSENRKRQ